jgi:hypothetical protein
VLVAIESELGLSLLPTATAAGYKVRPHKRFGMEPAMVVSLYSWEKAGDIGELVELMSRVLSKRYSAPNSA